MISPTLSTVFRTTSGNKFQGIFSDPEDRFEGDEKRAPRILRVNETALVSTGSIIKAHGTRYILFLHSQASGQKRFLAFQITDDLKWTRKETRKDPVTRMETGSYDRTLNEALPVYMEPDGTNEEKGTDRTRYLIRCAEGVEIGDSLGGYVVHSVQRVSGASIAKAY